MKISLFLEMRVVLVCVNDPRFTKLCITVTHERRKKGGEPLIYSYNEYALMFNCYGILFK